MDLQEVLGFALIGMFILGLFVIIYRLRTKSAYIFAAALVLTFSYQMFFGRDIAFQIAKQIIKPEESLSGPSNTAQAFEVLSLAAQIYEFASGLLLATTMLAFVFMAFSIPRPYLLKNAKL